MKFLSKTFYSSIVMGICILGAPTIQAENDINAQDLSRDLERNTPLSLDAKVINKQDAGHERLISESIDKDGNELNTEKEDSPPWFKVELLIFKQQPNDVGEHFPDNDPFKLPEDIRTLEGFEYPEQHSTRSQTLGIEYVNKKQPLETVILSASDRSIESESAEASTQDVLTSEPDQNIQENTSITPFAAYQLEPLELLIHAKEKISRRNTYEILLEAAWMQQTLPKEQMPTIHLVAGNWFDEQPELEVFFKVTKQRYLHAYADIFLKTYSLKTEQDISLDLESTLVTEDSTPKPSSFTSEQTPTTRLPSEKKDNLHSSNQGLQPHHFQLFSLNIDESILDTEKEDTSSYVTNEVYSIHEDRIMKHSKNYYYLDHPKFGVLIKVTPLEKLEELREETAE